MADYDDLLFAGRVSGLPASAGGFGSGREQHARLEHYAAAFTVFNRFTVSTRALARHVSSRAPNARVDFVPNGVSENWVRQGQALYRRFAPGDPLVVRYLAGSPSHDQDFAHIAAPLISFMERHPDVRLEIVGPVHLDVAAFPKGRMTMVRSLSYDELPRLLASTWVNLAPLQPSDFNDCKSAIKFLESGAFGCPTLASPADDVLRHEEYGAPVIVCRSDRDWYMALEAMLDAERRRMLGSAAAEYVSTHGMAQNSRAAWLSSLGAGEAP